MNAMHTAAAAALVGLIGASAHANLLLAPGFEAPPAPSAATNDQAIPGPIAVGVPATQNPWFYGKSNTAAAGSTAFYSSDVPAFVGTPPSNRLNSTPSGATAPNFKANDGNQYAYAYTVGQNSGQSTFVGQGVTGASVVAGHTYTASAAFFHKNVTGGAADGDRFQAGGSYDSLALVFLNASGATLSTAASAGRVDSTTAANVWTPLSLTAVAPTGTASIVFQAVLTRGATGGVMFVDSAALDDTTPGTPEPAALGLLAAGGALALRRRK